MHAMTGTAVDSWIHRLNMFKQRKSLEFTATRPRLYFLANDGGGFHGEAAVRLGR